MYYAEINNDSVCIGISKLGGQVASAKMIPIDTYDTTLMGKKWNGVKFVVSDIPVAKRKLLTRYEFRQLFTFDEQIAITTAAKTDIVVEVFMKSMEVAEIINLDYPETAQGLAYLVSLGLITEKKMNDILKGV